MPRAVPRPYHHGNLRAALLEAAVARARTDGPDAVVLRDVAADVGVSPSAAYRHVRDRDHLLALVAQVARQELARSMLTSVDAVPTTGDVPHDVVARFRATGQGYLRFALADAPLFRAAFTASGSAPDRPDDPDAASVLAGAIDGLIRSGLLADGRRTEASLIAWSSVHGLGCLLVDGVLTLSLGMTADHAIDTVLAGVLTAVVAPQPVGPSAVPAAERAWVAGTT